MSNSDTHTALSQASPIDATPGGLVKATLGSVAIAAAILTFVWLPAEYGIDPTGVGDMLGLTDMGEIKQQLQVEALADSVAASTREAVDGGTEYATILRRLDDLKTQIDTLSESLGARTSESRALPGDALPSDAAVSSASLSGEGASNDEWRDQVEYSLIPGQGIEVKLIMSQGEIAEYVWTANGSVLNHDTHGDGNGQNISYKQGRAVPGDAGTLTAAFTGYHGWFWRNRTEQTVRVTLQTRGEYDSMALP